MIPAAQEEILNRFKCLMAANRLAHAYLFVGPAETGKAPTALAVAQLVNCDAANAPCHDCVSCRKIASGNHPDVRMVGGDENEAIKIDDVRQVLGRVALRPFEARLKVFVLRDAQRMTTEAANALLKTLEEPAPNTLMILTTAVPEACLDTIKSRCHMVKFFCSGDRLPQDKDRILDVFLSRQDNEEFLKALSGDRQQTAQAMLVLLSWVRDVVLYKATADTRHVVYQGRLGDLKNMSQRNMDDLRALKAQIVRVKSLADENLNVKMALSLVRERLWNN
ncbi:MAG: DNA polymerase III subunit [Candidatus Omnitrophica bacterium]|nr:DNA polymerase III subunit [Candidatus Omnitrophota bacterium]